ncbi:MAG: hypothetical protein K2Q26_10785 [Bdellovibrionales bacterium]|nr:hypothetical protein [Bdellovibrionales bacterium]
MLHKIFDVKRSELSLLLWSWIYFFAILSAYYILRPLREEMGIAGGIHNLPWMYTGTLLTILVCNLPFALLAKKFSRSSLITIIYRFFTLNLCLFLFLFFYLAPEQIVWVGRAFFIWISVFNLFVCSVFWMLMVDVFNSEQGTRLFGIISAGGTLGGIAGSAVTAYFASRISPYYLLLASIFCIEVSILCARRISKLSKSRAKKEIPTEAVGGSLMSGLTHTLKSPYLLAISAYVLLFTITSTTLYFQQAEIVKANFLTPQEQTTAFAKIDLWVNILTLVSQMFLTSQSLRLLGVTLTLAIMPLLTLAGFSILVFLPTMTVLMIFQAARRAGEFSLARPTREILFTVVSREDKYKAKGFIDTGVYRLGDQVGAWSQALIYSLGLGITGSSMVILPITGAWLLTTFWLGQKYKRLAKPKSATSVEEVQNRNVQF